MNIVADTSAFAAILLKEIDADCYRHALLEAEKVIISTATAVELHIIVTAKLGSDGILRLNQLLSQSFQAYERYGKGRHPAKLNFGDLFAYALAKSQNLPLLFKGDDFSKTDLASCL